MRRLIWGLFLFCSLASAQEKLVLVGGGEIPPEAAERFVAWAGGKQAEILLIEWASGIPDESDQYLRETMVPFGPKAIDTAPDVTQLPAQKEKFLQQLSRATGVFFGGGDQNRVMDLLDANPDLLQALRATFQRSVFGGTSAGTAIMSATMITGEGDFTVIDPLKVGVRPGLGLIRDIIVDQHFIKRQRLNRLLSLLMKSQEKWGMGIDEGTSVALIDGRYAQVLGPNPVVLLNNREVSGKITTELIPPGSSFTLF